MSSKIKRESTYSVPDQQAKKETSDLTRDSIFSLIIPSALIALSLFIFFALFSSYKTPHSVNWCGMCGLSCSLFLRSLLGTAAYLIPLAGCLLSLKESNFSWIKLTSAVIIGLSACAILCSLPWTKQEGIHGGWIGSYGASLFMNYFDIVGSCIILTTLCFSILMVMLYACRRDSIADAYSILSVSVKASISIVRTCLVFVYSLLYKICIRDAQKNLRFSAAQTKECCSPKKEPEAHTRTVHKGKNVPLSYCLPPDNLLAPVKSSVHKDPRNRDIEALVTVLEDKLQKFHIRGSVTSIKQGPVVTLFEYAPESNTKLSKIVSLEDDLAMALQAVSVRILAPIPGRSVVGFEVAHGQRDDVSFASLITMIPDWRTRFALPLILGVDTTGQGVVVDLVTMPHLLIAGSTGSGKSVALNTMLMSILYARSPDDMKLILIDPKRLEFAAYGGLPHLIFPIITDPHKAIQALTWVIDEMNRRYECMARENVRSIDAYNRVHKNENLPLIVVIIDELADLMMTAGRDVEDLITRIAQMARAAGIYMIVATQRPSVDVVTGIIKVNFPSRISFRLTSKIDSRTILDSGGADKLLGKGDMLFLDSQSAFLRRIHGAYVSARDSERVVEFICRQRSFEGNDLTLMAEARDDIDTPDKQLFAMINDYLETIDEVSTSLLQRRFRLGYNRAARMIDLLEKQGRILPASSGKMRKVLK